MALFRFLGRALFVLSFVLFAYNLSQSAQLRTQQAQKFTEQYPKFYSWVMKDLNMQQHVEQYIPQGYIEPKVVVAHSQQVVEYSIYFIFGVSTMIFLGIPGGGFLLACFLSIVVLVLQNPLLNKNKFNYIRDSYDVLQYIALVGGALMMCCGFGCCGKSQVKQDSKKNKQSNQSAKTQPKTSAKKSAQAKKKQ